MVNVSTHSVAAPAQGSRKSYDRTIIVAAGLLFAGLIIVAWGSTMSVDVAQFNLDLMLAYP